MQCMNGNGKIRENNMYKELKKLNEIQHESYIYMIKSLIEDLNIKTVKSFNKLTDFGKLKVFKINSRFDLIDSFTTPVFKDKPITTHILHDSYKAVVAIRGDDLFEMTPGHVFWIYIGVKY